MPGLRRQKQKSWSGLLICLSACDNMMLFNYTLMMSMESNDKNEQGILLGIEEEMLISPHYHLNLYQTFLRCLMMSVTKIILRRMSNLLTEYGING